MNEREPDSPGRLLLVDDNPFNRDAFRMSLEREGFSVEAVESGAEALRRLGEGFDLILLDIQMPQLDGFEVLKLIRETHSATDLPVIMVTGRDRSQDVVSALDSGANDYLTKPVDFPVALARIRTQLLHKRAVELLRESELRLRQLDEMKNDFISMVNHELVAPITAIDGAIGFFNDKLFGPFNEKYEGYVTMIHRNVEHLTRLANDLSDITKMGGGRFSIVKTKVDLRQAVHNACRALQPKARERSIQIVDLVGAAPETIVDADGQRMEQVVSNILRNALKFAASRVTVSMEMQSGECRLIVEDDGPGIEPTDLPKIFDKFYRGKKGRDMEGGSGLGLAIVKGIVEGHAGTVSAENVMGETGERLGARFVVTLPV